MTALSPRGNPSLTAPISHCRHSVEHRDGSVGVGEARNHRMTGALTLVHPRLGLGVEAHRAVGYEGQPQRIVDGLGGWAEGVVLPSWLGLAVRFDWLDADAHGSNAGVTRLTAGVFTEPLGAPGPLRRLRLYATYQGDRYGSAAPPLPGASAAVDDDRVLVVPSLGATVEWTP